MSPADGVKRSSNNASLDIKFKFLSTVIVALYSLSVAPVRWNEFEGAERVTMPLLSLGLFTSTNTSTNFGRYVWLARYLSEFQQPRL